MFFPQSSRGFRRSGKSRNGRSFEEELTFEVTGLADHAQLGWLRRELTVGDSVVLKIISVETVDAPSSSEPRDDHAAVEEGQRRYFEHLKKKYGRKTTRPARTK